MPDFIIIGILIALAVAWKIRDGELRRKRQPRIVLRPARRPIDHPYIRDLQSRWVCRVPCGGRGHPRNKGEAWDICRREGAEFGIQEHWWRVDHWNGNGSPQWFAYKKKKK